MSAAGGLDRIAHGLDGGVSDGMSRHLKAGGRRAGDQVTQLFPCGAPNAPA